MSHQTAVMRANAARSTLIRLKASPAEIAAATANVAAAKIEAVIEKVHADAAPLTSEQRQHLADLILRGGEGR